MKVLQAGIDSLVIGYHIHDYINVNEFDELKTAKLKAQEKQFDGRGASVSWFGIDFMCKPRGVRGYEYVLENADFTVCIAVTPYDGVKMPEIYTTFRAEALWYKTPPVLVKVFKHWLEGWAVVIGEIVSRCDPCMDLELDYPDINIKNQLLTVAHKKSSHLDIVPAVNYMTCSRFTDLVVGSGALLGRFYDKVAESTIHQKEYMLDVLKARGWDGETGVTRAEFQMRRDFLRDAKRVLAGGVVGDEGVNTFDELIQYLPDLWTYCTRDWLRICEKVYLNHNQSKSKSTDYWQLIQSSYELYGAPQGMLRRRVKDVKYNHLEAQCKGIISSMTAVRASGEGLAVARFKVRQDLRDYLDSEDYRERVAHKIPAFSNMEKPDTHLIDAAIKLGAIPIEDKRR